MSKARRKTKSRAHSAPVTLTRHETERADESIVAVARDRTDGAKA